VVRFVESPAAPNAYPKLQKARVGGVLVHYQNRVHVLGGAGYPTAPAGESWLIDGSVPTSPVVHLYTGVPISGQGLAILGTTLYSLGGFQDTSSSPISDIYTTSLGGATPTSTLRKSSVKLAVARSHPTVIRTADRLYVLGGLDSARQPLATVEVSTLAGTTVKSVTSIDRADNLPAPVAGPVIDLDSPELSNEGVLPEGAQVRMLVANDPRKMLEMSVSGGQLGNPQIMDLEGVPEEFVAGDVTFFRYKNLEFLLSGPGQLVARRAGSRSPFQETGAALLSARHRPMVVRTGGNQVYIVGGASAGGQPFDTMVRLFVP